MKPVAFLQGLRVSRAELLFSIKSFAASMLAFYIADRAGLPRPFWAMLTTYVVASPFAGNVRSKALFRFFGTLLGCVAVVIMVPTFVNAPELLSLVLASWLGLCLYLSLLDRTARSYVFMLAGYTAALIGFPSVEAPTLLFDNAVARVVEISLGILCATVVHSIVLPVGLAPSLLALLDRSLGDVRHWFDDMLAPARQGSAERASLLADRQRLAIDITQLRLLSTHVPFDTGNLRWTAGAIRAMQDRIASLTPYLSAVEDRLQALVAAEGRLADDVGALLDLTARWLRAENGEADANSPSLQTVRDALQAFGSDAARGDGSAQWSAALRVALAMRMQALLTGWLDCAALRRTIDAGLQGSAMPLRRATGFSDGALHRVRGLALLSSFAAMISVLVCSAFWIVTAFPSGSVAPLMAAVFCSFFATLDDPAPMIASFLKWTLWSLPISAIYVLVLLPLVHDFGMLVLVCAPLFLVLGCLAARPATSLAGLALIIGVAGTLALHDTSSNVDIPSFLNSNIAEVIGITTSVLVTRLLRSVGADWSARRIRRATWRELSALSAASHGPADEDAYAIRMLDRISLLAPRIAGSQADARDEVADAALRDLRIGTDIIALQRLRREWRAGAAHELAEAATSLLGAVSRLFRERARREDAKGSSGLLAQIDTALGAALDASEAASADARRVAVTALVGLRRNLFPDAASALAGATAAVTTGVTP